MVQFWRSFCLNCPQNRVISATVLSDGLSETIKMGTQEGVNKRTFWTQQGYTYLLQKGDSADEFKKKMRNSNNNDESYGYSECTKGDIWNCLSQILLTKRQQKNTWTIFLRKLRPPKKRNQQSGPLLRYILRVWLSRLENLIHLITRTLRGDTLMQDIPTCT